MANRYNFDALEVHPVCPYLLVPLPPKESFGQKVILCFVIETTNGSEHYCLAEYAEGMALPQDLLLEVALA